MATIEKEKALDVVRQMVADGQVSQEVAEKYFPELKESEGERTRKYIINHLQEHLKTVREFLNNGMSAPFSYEEIKMLEASVAWLEKQGEQKPADKVEQKFKVGDWVVYDHRTYQIVELPQGRLINASLSRNGKTEQVPLPYCEKWSIQDAKNGDVLNSMRVQATIIFKGFADDSKHILAYCALQKGIFIKQEMLWDRDFEPCPKNWNNELFSKMHEAGYEWDAEKKKLKKIEEEVNGEDYGIDSLYHAQRILEKTLGKVDGYQSDDGILEHKCAISAVKKLYEQKPNWSEEDGKNLEKTIWYVEKGGKLVFAKTDKLVSWLKSLRPQWKPSEAQISALDFAIDCTVYPEFQDKRKVLIELLEQLKQL